MKECKDLEHLPSISFMEKKIRKGCISAKQNNAKIKVMLTEEAVKGRKCTGKK